MTDDIFIDTNILVYLVDEDSKFHKNALKKLKSFKKNSKFWISRQVIREYSVITTRLDLISSPLSTDKLVILK